MKKVKEMYKKNEELCNYIIVGVMTTIISLLIYYISVFAFLNPDNLFQLQIANILSWIGGVIFAYIANRKIVFKSKEANVKKESFKFVSSRVFTLVVDMVFMFITVTILKLDDKIMKLGSNIIITIVNYLLSKLIVFKK